MKKWGTYFVVKEFVLKFVFLEINFGFCNNYKQKLKNDSYILLLEVKDCLFFSLKKFHIL